MKTILSFVLVLFALPMILIYAVGAAILEEVGE